MKPDETLNKHISKPKKPQFRGQSESGCYEANGVGKYRVILADPPWTYNNPGCQGTAANQYKTMNDKELLNLPIRQFAAENSILLLWGTWPKLKEICLPVMEGWGFDYVTGFPWIKITDFSRNMFGEIQVKVPYGIGFWARGCTEIVLIGKRGNPKPPPNGFIGLLSPNLFHSRKPDSLYSFAEAMEGPYLELFARRKREGWHSWGNEIESDIDMGELVS